MKRSILLSSFVLIAVTVGVSNYKCGNSSQNKPIDEKLFVQIYCDVVIYADLVDSKQREAFVDSVLSSHNVNREQFQNTIKIYSRDEKKWEKIFDRIVAELEQREKVMKTNGDSTHVITLRQKNGKK